MDRNPNFDAIIIGSGTSGATIARELARAQKKVLLLERGGMQQLRETLVGIASIADEVKLGPDNLSSMRAITTGGSTALYFGVAHYPPVECFREHGIDLSAQLAEARTELPINKVPDELLGEQMTRLRDSAVALGLPWQKNDMLIDLAKCGAHYTYEAKWKARSYVDDAVRDGATLISQCTVQKVLVDSDTAVGVEYRTKKGGVAQAFGSKVILAAGEMASPQLLRASGLGEVGDRGFYCNPGYAIYGLVPGLKARSSFVGCMGGQYDEGIELGDANIPQALHRPMMLGGMKLRHMFAFPRTIGIGVKVKDGFGGELRPDGRLHKSFDGEDLRKLEAGKREAVRILQKAGARHIVDFGLTAAGRVGGLVRLGEHVDQTLQTRFRNLHVCDGSVIPDGMRGAPAITVWCLAKHLSKHLLAS